MNASMVKLMARGLEEAFRIQAMDASMWGKTHGLMDVPPINLERMARHVLTKMRDATEEMCVAGFMVPAPWTYDDRAQKRYFRPDPEEVWRAMVEEAEKE